MVNPKTGELNLKKAFPVWKTAINQFWQVFTYAKKVFDFVDKEMDYEIDPKSKELSEIFYIESVRLYKSNFEVFQSKVAETVEMLKIKIYDPPNDYDDANAIIFGDFNPEIHQKVREELLRLKTPFNGNQENVEHPSYSGLSWIQNESLFSKSAF